MYFCAIFGGMAEWSIAAVLKTVDLHGSGGSNPSSSARPNEARRSRKRSFCFYAYGTSLLADEGIENKRESPWRLLA